MVRRKC